MKVKTSITLSEELLQRVDEIAGSSGKRSALFERAVREYLANRARSKRDEKDLEILNRDADQLNEEASDVLSYQGDT